MTDQKLIFDWCGHIRVPTWVPDTAYTDCKYCGDPMKKKSHHCRLCGHLFCELCTDKYMIPAHFDLKGKKGPARVCIGCKNSCLQAKREAQGTPAAKIIYPPEVWENRDLFQSCPKCKKKAGASHNCRVCGRLFCSGCTHKITVPAIFKKKKNKDGLCRACDYCIADVQAGAVLSESEKPPEVKETEEDMPKRRPTITPTFTMSPLSRLGDELTRRQEPVTINVRMEGSSSSLCTLQTVFNDTTLQQLDIMIRGRARIDFEHAYIFRNTIVPEPFWDIFIVKNLLPTLMVRNMTVWKAAQAPAPAPRAPIPSTAPAIPAPPPEDIDASGPPPGAPPPPPPRSAAAATATTTTATTAAQVVDPNPYKSRALPKPPARGAAGSEAPKQETKSAFQAPKLKPVFKPPALAAASLAPKMPPPPTSSSGPGAADLSSGEDVFKKRAQAMFGLQA